MSAKSSSYRERPRIARIYERYTEKSEVKRYVREGERERGKRAKVVAAYHGPPLCPFDTEGLKCLRSLQMDMMDWTRLGSPAAVKSLVHDPIGF